jgi:hypothetical protein
VDIFSLCVDAYFASMWPARGKLIYLSEQRPRRSDLSTAASKGRSGRGRRSVMMLIMRRQRFDTPPPALAAADLPAALIAMRA